MRILDQLGASVEAADAGEGVGEGWEEGCVGQQRGQG